MSKIREVWAQAGRYLVPPKKPYPLRCRELAQGPTVPAFVIYGTCIHLTVAETIAETHTLFCRREGSRLRELLSALRASHHVQLPSKIREKRYRHDCDALRLCITSLLSITVARVEIGYLQDSYEFFFSPNNNLLLLLLRSADVSCCAMALAQRGF
jgi:hypothetical protein